jgi:16S rRNA (cytidine1402-2'-O)-methyltransferase
VTGALYLIPTTLGDSSPDEVLPQTVRRTVLSLADYIAENEKTARRFIKSLVPEIVQATLSFSTLNKHTDEAEHFHMMQPLFEGRNMGLLSEAGCPGIADPGAAIVRLAHERNIRVVPLVGPSSILLAMMASGMNGQSFSFVGYLPIDKGEKKSVLKNLEKLSDEKGQAQIFIETPYRNNRMLEDLINVLHPATRLCVAADITLPTESIRTLPVSKWAKEKADLQNRPCIFIIQK